MAKLSRIIKKIVAKPSLTGTITRSTITESLASKGKTQPTVDFSNLGINYDELSQMNESTGNSKRKVTVKKSNKTDIKKTRPKESTKSDIKKDIRKRVLSKLRASNGSESSSSADLHQTQLDKSNKGISVIKNITKSQSRGKRKREMRKEAWRRRFAFESEAKKILEMYKKEDKHGKALGNLDSLKTQLDDIEESMNKTEVVSKGPIKRGKKYRQYLMMKNRQLYDVATKTR